MAIVQLFPLTLVIGRGHHDDQAKRTPSGAALPEHTLTCLWRTVRRFPRMAVVLAHMFRRKLLGPIKPTRIGRGAPTQSRILAGPDQQHRPFRNLCKTGAMTRTTIAGQDRGLVAASGLIEFLPKLLAHFNKTARQIERGLASRHMLGSSRTSSPS